jgi:hypothetical protein
VRLLCVLQFYRYLYWHWFLAARQITLDSMFIWRYSVVRQVPAPAGMAILLAVRLVLVLAGMATSSQFWVDRQALVLGATAMCGADRQALALGATATSGVDRPALALAATEISFSFTNALRGMAAPDRSV